jgi:WD40 repeat protein
LGKENAVGFSVGADDRFFAVAWRIESGGVRELRAQVFDAQAAMPLRQSMVLPGSWTNLVISAGGRWLFAFSAEAGAVWATASGQRAASFTNGCMEASFSPNGQLLAVVRGSQVEVLDSERSFARLARCRHPTGSRVNSIQWDPESRRLITACWDTTFTPLWAQTWIARTGEPAGPPLNHRDGVLYAAFSHDGGRAITCGEDFNSMIWDPSTGRELAPPLRHGDKVCSAAFSDDDRLVATITVANVMTVWSGDTAEPLSSLALPTASQSRRYSIHFAANNKAVISREGLERGYFWDLPIYERSLNDLLLTAQLLSGQQTDSTETLMPQSKEALRGLWEQLRARFPEQFSL